MQYLITQIFLYLVAAAGTGWLIGRFTTKTREASALRSLNEWQEKYYALEQYRNRLKKENHSLNKTHQKHLREMAQLRVQLTGMKARSQTVAAEERGRTDRVELYKKALMERDQMIQKLRQRVEASENKVKHLLARVSALSSSKRQFEERLQDQNGENDLLSTQIFDLNTETKSAQSRLRLITSERDKLNAEVELLSKERAEYQDRVDTLIEEQESLMGKVRELKGQTEEYETHLAELRSDMNDLTTQVLNVSNERDNYLKKLRKISSLLEVEAEREREDVA